MQRRLPEIILGRFTRLYSIWRKVRFQFEGGSIWAFGQPRPRRNYSIMFYSRTSYRECPVDDVVRLHLLRSARYHNLHIGRRLGISKWASYWTKNSIILYTIYSIIQALYIRRIYTATLLFNSAQSSSDMLPLDQFVYTPCTPTTSCTSSRN